VVENKETNKQTSTNSVLFIYVTWFIWKRYEPCKKKKKVQSYRLYGTSWRPCLFHLERNVGSRENTPGRLFPWSKLSNTIEHYGTCSSNRVERCADDHASTCRCWFVDSPTPHPATANDEAARDSPPRPTAHQHVSSWVFELWKCEVAISSVVSSGIVTKKCELAQFTPFRNDQLGETREGWSFGLLAGISQVFPNYVRCLTFTLNFETDVSSHHQSSASIDANCVSRIVSVYHTPVLEVPSARLTLHSTKLCTKFKLKKKNTFWH
jgi:hypothetical protein